MPSRVISTASLVPVVWRTSMRLSPGSMPMAMMPPLRTLAKSLSEVFFTVPSWVAKRTKPPDVQVMSLACASLRDSTRMSAATFSPGFISRRFAMERPLAARPIVGNLVHALNVDATRVGEEHQVIVGRGGEEMLDEIGVLGRVAFARGHADDATAAAALRAVAADVRPLDLANCG